MKVDPADVVAVPPDYNHSKMRVCKYLVLSEVDVGSIKKIETQKVATEKDTPVVEGVQLNDVQEIQKAAAKRSANKIKTLSDEDKVFRTPLGEEYSAIEILAEFDKQGQSPSKMSQALNISRSTVRRWVEKAREMRAAQVQKELAAARPDPQTLRTGDMDRVFWQLENGKYFRTPAQLVENREKYQSNASWAQELGVAKSTATRWLQKAKERLENK